MGNLYLVATPIGNLEDISKRAIDILSRASLIAAEDTRHTRKLLEHYHIQARLTSYYEQNKKLKLEHILVALEEDDVALVSDAGTPALNDPGYELVRAALQAGHQVIPVPGASAPVAALVASGLPTNAFLYLGYLPRKNGERRQALEQVAHLPYTLIFLEAPHRILESLADIRLVLGDRQMAVARELTKIHEEFLRGPVSEAILHFTTTPPRGEFTLVVAGYNKSNDRWSEDQLTLSIQERLTKGDTPKKAAETLAVLSGWSRREIYRLALNLY